MSLFSFLRKNKQESASDDSAFRSRTEEESNAVRGRGKRRRSNQEEPVDPVLPEKKRARRRLIGAVALVLAAVIGLPMILDTEPKPLADDIAIQIPSKDKPAQPSRENRQPAATPSSKVPASTSLDPTEEVIEPSPAAGTNEKQTAKTAAAASVTNEKKAGGELGETSKSPTAGKPAVMQSSKTESRAEAKPVEKPDDASRAIALLQGKPDPKTAAEKKSGKFVIQVAALATKEKVNELQAKLKNAGIKSYTQKVATDSGERIRIRVGPFDSKDDADRMRARIGKLGMTGTLIPA
jgi:DedD protein